MDRQKLNTANDLNNKISEINKFLMCFEREIELENGNIHQQKTYPIISVEHENEDGDRVIYDLSSKMTHKIYDIIKPFFLQDLQKLETEFKDL